MKDLYHVLGVASTASYEDIRSAYHRKIKLYHPDNADTGDTEKLYDVMKAYEILSDPFKKAMYNCDYKVWVGKGNANRKKEEGNVPEYDAKLKAEYKEVLESVSGKIYIAYNEGMCMEEYLLKKKLLFEKDVCKKTGLYIAYVERELS